MSDCKKIEKFFYWNGCEDALKQSIERSRYVKKVRSKLMKKKLKYVLKN